MTHRRIKRWGVGLVATLALTGFGLLFASERLIVAAAIPLAYVLYGTLSRVPDGEFTVTRSFETPDPTPGEEVAVTLTVENTGDSVLTDCRIIDGVPEELAVVDGAPRACVAIPPGEATELTYTVVTKRGEYDFGDPTVRLRSLAATERQTETVAVDGDETLSCANAVRDPPVQDASLRRAGTLPTDTGGSGLEFYATRQYQSGDPMNRVDWRHYAKTGEFVTVQYRQEQAIRTVLIVDARPVGRITPQPGYPTGAELCAYAGERLFDALSAAGVATSVTAVGIEQGTLDGLVGPDGLPWVDPESSGHRDSHARTLFSGLQTIAESDAETSTLADLLERRRASDGLATPAREDAGTVGEGGESATTTVAPDGGLDEQTRHLLARLPPNAQVVLCTPLVDDWPADLARSLAVRGYPLVVVSPDVTGADTVGQRIVETTRQFTLQTIERTGATTVSWDIDQPIDYALRRSLPHLLSDQ
ncbi:DUF58 domain-containing protein [Salinibaculum rarum]|uniref:DUF58 domain-containing protein n=1 Tax=Salinibaculum rarum TaxID=3058903 RepID=UPI00265F5215|nr:DUF58 domain-containing protein [Salinibaculum sp. KK48]